MYFHRILLVLLGAILVAGMGSARIQAQADLLTPLEQAHILEVRGLVGTYGSDLWPGWSEVVPPMLISKGEIDLLIGHPSPPEGFELQPDLVVDGLPVFWMEGHLLPQPAATAWPVGEIWTVAAPSRADFQALIDAYLGPGVVVLTDAEYVRTLVHEAFHTYQIATHGGPENLPLFGMEPGGEDWYDTLTAEGLLALDAQQAVEGAALRAALEAKTLDQQRAAAARFLDLRETRRATLPPEAVPFEQNVEWIEGAARYIDVSMMLLTGAPGYSPTALGDEVPEFSYLSAATIWDGFLNQLSDPASIPGTFRDRYYVSGAGIAFLLDDLMPGWKERVWLDDVALEALLAEVVVDPE